jgi:TATA-box binding protein (TBP) (component of TFIID and TFIIIB)
MSAVTILCVCATASTGQAVTIPLPPARRSTPPRTTVNPYRHPQPPKSYTDATTGVKVFASGRMIIKDARSVDAAMTLLATAAQKHHAVAQNVRIVNIVARWSAAPSVASGNHFVAPNIVVMVRPDCFVQCVGATNMDDLMRAFSLYH